MRSIRHAVAEALRPAGRLWPLEPHRPSSPASYLLATPIFGMLSAAWLMGDRLTPDLLVSRLLAAAGIGLTAR